MASKRKATKNQEPKQGSPYNQVIKIQEKNSKRLDRWLESFNFLLGEIASFEVNTSFVEKVTTEKFIPWQGYQELYAVSRQNLAKLNIHLSLHEHYLRLRRQLELEYFFLLVDPKSELYDEIASKQIKQDLAILTQPNADWEQISSRLPNPLDADKSSVMLALHQLLNNYPFLRSLRKLNDIKHILDKHNQVLCQSKSTDIVYAQTRIQLDGQIDNCYDKKLLSHPDKQTILELHKQGVEAGEIQWQGLIKFIMTIIQKHK